MCADCRTDASESNALEMTSEKLLEDNAYIEISHTGMYLGLDRGWIYRLTVEEPSCRLVCRKDSDTDSTFDNEEFVFDIDKAWMIGLFEKFAKFQFKLSPPGHRVIDGDTTCLTIGSDWGFIEVQWCALYDDYDEQLDELVESIVVMASRMIDLQRDSPDMKIRAIRFCKIQRTDTCNEHANIEKTIGLRYAGGAVYALDSENREFGQFSPEDSTFILDNISIDRQLKICAGNWFGEADDSTMDALVLEYTSRK